MALTFFNTTDNDTLNAEFINRMGWTGGYCDTFNYGGSYTYWTIGIFSGPRLEIPRTNELADWQAAGWSDVTNAGIYSVDNPNCLVYKVMTNAFEIVEIRDNVAILKRDAFPATDIVNSGTATWFTLSSAYQRYSGHKPSAMITGTVGTIGSGADLTLPDVNLVAGEKLEIPNGMRFNPITSMNNGV